MTLEVTLISVSVTRIQRWTIETEYLLRICVQSKVLSYFENYESETCKTVSIFVRTSFSYSLISSAIFLFCPGADGSYDMKV